MPAGSPGSPEVDIVVSARPQAALELLYGGGLESGGADDARLTLEAAARGELSLDGLLEARRDGRLVGAIWGQVGAGRGALIRPPQLAPGEPETTAERLLVRLNGFLRAEGVEMAQALLAPEASRDCERLLEDGFLHAADLLYMVCFAERFPASPPHSELQFEPYEDRQRQRLADLLDRTYSGTRDLPMLNGVRRIDDVIAGYRETGVFDSRRWLFVRSEEKDIGCLLMTDHPAEEQWELMYMGLVPEARGRGWGLQITRHGQWLAGRSGRARMVLAADAGNGPALRVYESAGFVIWNRRRVLLKFFEAAREKRSGGAAGAAQ